MVLLRGEYKPITYDKKYDAVQKSNNLNIQLNFWVFFVVKQEWFYRRKDVNFIVPKNITKM